MNGSEAAAKQAERIAELVRGRAKTHGDAVEQHDILAKLWSDHLGVEVSTKDAMYMLLLLKVSRIAAGGVSHEHIEDIAGYACLIMGEREIARQKLVDKMAGQSGSITGGHPDAQIR